MGKKEAAIALAAKGFRVFLLGLDSKIPAIDVVTDMAINDPIRVAEMWTDPFGGPRDENIGVSTDTLFIMDFDAKAGRELMEKEFAAYKKVFNFRHVVRTTNGGYHAYMRLPAGVRIKGKVKAKAFGETIDIRSWHNYVVGPGSDIKGLTYEWIVSVPDQLEEPRSVEDLDFAHPDLLEKCERPAERESQELNIQWDEPAALSQAKEYLLHHAPEAKQGEGGDEQTYKIACKVRQFGVSQDAALLMIDEHWNQTKAHPPWSLEELDKKLDNAYAYAKAAPHVPGSEYEAVDLLPPQPATNPLTLPFPQATELKPFDFADIPKRQWIVEGVLARRFVTLLGAPPGAGKTQWLAQLLVGVAFNQSTLANARVREMANVWSWNAEDDTNELKRRIGATMKHFGVTWDMPRAWVAIDSGVDHSLKVASMGPNGVLVENKAAIATIIDQIKQHNIGVLIVDPLAELHTVPEKENDYIKLVLAIFRTIAQRANCAVMVATHTRKPSGASSDGFAGNQDSIRGGASQGGVARIVLTMYNMSKADAKEWGVPADTRGEYVRLDTAKGNIVAAGRGARPKWFKFEEVILQHGDDADKVGVLNAVDLAASRLVREGEADPIEVMAEILNGRADAGSNVSWREVVLPAFMERTGKGERWAKGWMSDLSSKVSCSLGEIHTVKKLGQGGTLVKLVSSKTADVLD